MNYTDLDILYLTPRGTADYLQDAVYLGFQELGCNIVDYPLRPSLHGGRCPSEQLCLNFPESKLRKESPDLMVVTGLYQGYGSCGSFQGWANFISESLEKYNPYRFIMLDAEDGVACSYPILKRNFDRVFKRELFFKQYDNWDSINFASMPEPFEYVYYPHRRYDVSFISTLTHSYRRDVKDFLLKKTKELNLSAFIYLDSAPLPRTEYLRVLSQSKTAVSVRGGGCDCYRYWEIPAKGVAMIADNPGLLIENDFNKEQVFKFKDLNELEQILINIKSMPISILETMALKSLQHTAQFHTPKKRAEYIIRKTFNQLDVDGISKQMLDAIDLTDLNQYAMDDIYGFFLKEAGIEHYRLLSYISESFNKIKIVDIGTCYGYSALALSKNRSNEVITYDLCDLIKNDVKSIKHIDNITIKIKNCLQEIDEVVAADIIFLDVDPHDGIQEKQILGALINSGFKGLLFLDDIHLNKGMEDFWGEIRMLKKDLTHLGHKTGTGIVYFK